MKKKNLSDLIQTACELQEFYDLINLMTEYDELKNYVALQVKGKGNSPALLPTLKKCHKRIDKFDTNGEIFGSLHDDFDDCIDYLDKNYSIKSKWLKRPEDLREDDFSKISDDLDRMIRTILGYSDKLTIINSDKQSTGKFSASITKSLDKKSKDDFKEALTALEFGLTTASFMLFCRVAESLANSYYEKFTHNISKGKKWNDMFKEIKAKQENERNVQRPVLALFDFLRDKRNKAQHPGERFAKKDCQKILHYLEDFQKEISKH